jgi:hypothetical protein
MKSVDTPAIDWYDSKQNNQEIDEVNNCPNIKMPPPREDIERGRRPYDVPLRAEATVDLDFERTFYDRQQAFVGLGLAMNALGNVFKLKHKYISASWALQRAGVRFEIISDEEFVPQTNTH